MLTHNRINSNLVLLFSNLNKSQISKMPYRHSSHDENELVMSSSYLNLLKPNEYTEDYRNRKPNGESFLFKIEEKNYIYIADNVVSFETNDELIFKTRFQR